MSQKKVDRKTERSSYEEEGNIVRIKRPAQSKILAHRMRRFTGFFIAVLLITVAFGVLYYRYQNKVYTGYEVLSAVDRVQVETSNVLSFNNYFLTYSKDGVHCTDSKGNDIWSTPFEMQEPIVKICGDYVAITDYNGRIIYIFNSGGEVGTIQTNNPIRNLQVAANGVIAAVVDDGDVTPIYLYRYDGTQLASFRTTMTKSGYPLAIGMSQNSKLVGVSYLYLDEGQMTTKVAFYNFDEVGKNETDNLVSGYDYKNEVVPIIEFLDESTAFAVANDKLMFYQGKERPTSVANIMLQEEIKSVYYGNGYVGLVYLDASGEARYCMDIYNSRGKLLNQLKFDLEYTEIFFEENSVVIYNASAAEIYTIQGNKKFAGDFENSIMLMLPTNNSTKYILVTKEQIQTITLQ